MELIAGVATPRTTVENQVLVPWVGAEDGTSPESKDHLSTPLFLISARADVRLEPHLVCPFPYRV